MEKDETIAWSMKAKKSFKRKVSRVAKVVDLSASQLVRAATDEKMKQIALENPRVAQILAEEEATAA